MTPLPPTVTTGLPIGPQSPDYVDQNSPEKQGQLNNSKIPQGDSPGKGVILAKDSLSVPLEIAWGIANERSGTSRPALMPVFRMLDLKIATSSSFGMDEYEELRNQLPPQLKQKLEKDEQLPFRDRDPDLIALDNSLKFEALRRAYVNQVSNMGSKTTEDLHFQQLPETTKQNLMQWAGQMNQELQGFLNEIGSNHPGYDLFLKAFNQIKETIDLLHKQ